MPWEDGVTLTPLPEPGKPAFLSGYIEDATNRERPARVVNPGGGDVEATYFAPALLYPVSSPIRDVFRPEVPIAICSMRHLCGDMRKRVVERSVAVSCRPQPHPWPPADRSPTSRAYHRHERARS